jgi:hypothetical protein
MDAGSSGSQQSIRHRGLKLPVCEPSTFSLIDEISDAEWTLVSRRSRSANRRRSPSLLSDQNHVFKFQTSIHPIACHTGHWRSGVGLGQTGRSETHAGSGLRGFFGAAWKQSSSFAPRVSFIPGEGN